MRSAKAGIAGLTTTTRLFGKAVLGGKRRPFGKPAFNLPLKPEGHPRKAEPSICRLGIQIGDQRLARCGHRHRRFGKTCLDGGEPGLVATPLGQQRRALANHLFIAAGASDMRRIKRNHQPVQKPPP